MQVLSGESRRLRPISMATGVEAKQTMADLTIEAESASWSSVQVYGMAAICLALGLTLGYLFRGSQTQSSAASAAVQAGQPAQAMPQQMPTLEQMKHMADKQAEPLLAQLKSDPNNAGVLKKVAKVYESTHQFKEAAGYYEKALEVNPKDVPTRTEMASCLYYNGDVNGALAQLQQALSDAPGDANALFNTGMIRWKGNNDVKGALQAWKQLLKSNPKLETNKKAQVEKLIAEAKQSPAN
jgi:cytochrome c-type biogenesis protein CcmH/NrfG